LHNLVAYHGDFISGSVPDGDEAFQTLANMGIKTIISVDGSEPDLDRASANGLRYIHLPIGYDGFDETRRLELTKAAGIALADGPVYIHCHHGKHRSAGAAAVIAVSLGFATPDEVIERMHVSGTAENYTGLYQCAANATPVDDAALDAIPDEFPSISHPVGMVKTMVQIDHATEHLKAIEAATWSVPTDHPDLVPSAQAGQLADLLRFLAQDRDTLNESDEFQFILGNSQRDAQQLENMIVDGKATTIDLSAQFKLITTSCKTCHTKFRD
jgi:protein tyrosine phosphatase (PTP) superfamily phosphohydrolase (DUF442 family)